MEKYVVPINVRKVASFGFFLFDGMEREEVIISIVGIIVGIIVFAILKPYSMIKASIAIIVIVGFILMMMKPERLNNTSLYREAKQYLKYKKSQKLYKYTQL